MQYHQLYINVKSPNYPFFKKKIYPETSIRKKISTFSPVLLSTKTNLFLSLQTEKGILKKHGYTLALGDQIKDKWGDDGQSDNMELMAQQDVSGGVTAASEVERTLKSLNGYHEDILEALRNAASHRGTSTGNTPVGSNSLSEEMLRKTLQECTANSLNYVGEYKRGGSTKSSRENICDANPSHAILIEGVSGLSGTGSMIHQHHHRSQHHLHQAAQQQQQQQQQPLQPGDDDDAPATGPLRIRNLEDLIRQLEQHSSRHMSPSGSEDIRMSETEADRHYRLDSSAACSESSQGLVVTLFFSYNIKQNIL